jgi:hypothetical protein
VTKIIRAPRLLVLVAITALAALALATAGGVAAAPGGQGKGKAGAKGYKVSRGATTLDLSDAATAAFGTAGVTLSPDTPAKTDSDGNWAFPVTNGRVKITKNAAGDITAATGKISHSGGFTLTKGDTTISVRNLRIVLDADPDLTAFVVAGGEPQGRISIADLEVGLSQISTASTGKRKRSLMVENVVAKLNQGSVDALNGFFGTTFAAGDVLGDASVKTRIVGRFPA